MNPRPSADESNALALSSLTHYSFILCTEPVDECGAAGHEAENGLGDEIYFYDCTATIITSEKSEFTDDCYEAVVYWQMVSVFQKDVISFRENIIT